MHIGGGWSHCDILFWGSIAKHDCDKLWQGVGALGGQKVHKKAWRNYWILNWIFWVENWKVISISRHITRFRSIDNISYIVTYQDIWQLTAKVNQLLTYKIHNNISTTTKCNHMFGKQENLWQWWTLTFYFLFKLKLFSN